MVCKDNGDKRCLQTHAQAQSIFEMWRTPTHSITMDLKAALVSLERKPSSSQVRLQVDGLLFRTFPSHQVIDAQAKTLLTHLRWNVVWLTGGPQEERQTRSRRASILLQVSLGVSSSSCSGHMVSQA